MDATQFLGMLVPALVSVGSLFIMIRKLNGVCESRKIEPQPLVVKGETEYIDIEQCRRQHQAEQRFLDTQFTQIKDQLTNLTTSLDRRNQEGEQRASGIHKRIDYVASDLAKVRGTMEEHIAHGRHQQ
jgi:uncharacterized protein YicC (UPF0701 family)